MAKGPTTPAQLAQAAGMDLDETLLRIWDAGISYVVTPGTPIRGIDLNRARRAVGVPTRREITSPNYWQRVFRLDESEFAELLNRLAIHPRSGSRTLPKGSIAKLTAELRRRNLPATIDLPANDTFIAEPEPFVWRQIGHRMELRPLTVQQVLMIHAELVRDFYSADDPIVPSGARGQALIDSAVCRPQTSLGDIAKYETAEMSAAALLHALIHDHPFHNGNKRTALVATLVFLDDHGIIITSDEDALFKFVLQIAQHRIVGHDCRDHLADREVLAIAEWLKNNSRLIEKGERSISFRKLRQILQTAECEFEFPAGVGNRINIIREVPQRHPLLRFVKSKQALRTQVAYRNEGSDVEKNTIAKIRSDLELDEAHGVDSRCFYDGAPTSAGDFIVRYRKLLRRLAKV